MTATGALDSGFVLAECRFGIRMGTRESTVGRGGGTDEGDIFQRCFDDSTPRGPTRGGSGRRHRNAKQAMCPKLFVAHVLECSARDTCRPRH